MLNVKVEEVKEEVIKAVEEINVFLEMTACDYCKNKINGICNQNQDMSLVPSFSSNSGYECPKWRVV